MKRILYKLLLARISPAQFLGFALANLFGASIILLGVKSYTDFTAALNNPEGAIASNFVVVAPKINSAQTALQAFGVKQAQHSFSPAEIDAMIHHPGVAYGGVFRSANFKVSGAFSLGETQWSTVMFVESVPDAFLDVDPGLWTAQISGTTVPIVLPRAYLNVLNYAFAASRSDVPQMGETLIRKLPVTLQFTGNGRTGIYKAQVVGFSDRINSILVPDDFLSAALERFADPGKPVPVSRVILRPNGEDDDGLLQFLSERGYTFDGTGQDALKLVSLVRGIAALAVLLGLLISLLAFFLLVVSIHLLMEKNRDKHQALRSLGFPPRQVCRPYRVSSMLLSAGSFALAFLLARWVYPVFGKIFRTYNPDMIPSSWWLVAAVAFGLFILFSAIHTLLLRREIND